MSWLEILATNHPMLLILMVVSIVLGIGATIVSLFRKNSEAIQAAIAWLTFLWILAGIGYYFVS